MKNIGLVCLLLVSICCGLQAKKIVKVPYFMACNTRSIEVEQVTLGKDTTWLAVRLYGMQGDRVRIDSTAVLNHQTYSQPLSTKPPHSPTYVPSACECPRDIPPHLYY